jgi:hypothetical protein
MNKVRPQEVADFFDMYVGIDRKGIFLYEDKPKLIHKEYEPSTNTAINALFYDEDMEEIPVDLTEVRIPSLFTPYSPAILKFQVKKILEGVGIEDEVIAQVIKEL